jgi:hypothetical protein
LPSKAHRWLGSAVCGVAAVRAYVEDLETELATVRARRRW